MRTTKNNLLIFCFLIIAFSFSSKQEQCWVVTKFRIGNNVSSFDERDANRYIGRRIKIDVNKVIIFGDTCFKPSFKVEKVGSVKFLNEEYAESDFSIIPSDSVEVIRIRCITEPRCSNQDSLNFNYNLIKVNSSELIVPINGIYFMLEEL